MRLFLALLLSLFAFEVQAQVQPFNTFAFPYGNLLCGAGEFNIVECGRIGKPNDVLPSASTVANATAPTGFINVMSPAYGVDNTGAIDAAPAIQAAINAASATNSPIYFPCGTYLISSNGLSLPNNAQIKGAGWCTILKMSATLASGNIISVASVSNVIISDIQLDSTLAVTGTHAIHLNAATGVRIDRVFVQGNGSGGTNAQDGIAITSSSDVITTHSRVVNVKNACYDQWGGSSDITYAENYCDVSSITGAYGILVTGMNTDLTPATTVRAKIIGNTVKNAGQAGIWVQGGWNQVTGGGATFGVVSDTVITDNIIDTVTTFHGIRVSDSTRITISSNIIKTVQVDAIQVQSENAGAQNNILIAGNIISGCNGAAGANSCILLSTTTTASQVIDNNISGTAQNYSVQITSESSGNVIANNLMTAGGTGRILDSGTLDQVIDTNGPISTVQNATGPYYTFANTANSRSASIGVVDGFNAILNASAGANVELQVNGGAVVNGSAAGGIAVGTQSNKVVVNGNNTGSTPFIATTGTSDANVGLNITPKGTGIVSIAAGAMLGSLTPLTLNTGELGLQRIAASGSAPGAAGLKIGAVCGTNSGTAKIIAYAGTSTTPVTIVDNIGAAVTGC